MLRNWEREIALFEQHPETPYAGSEPAYITKAREAGRKRREQEEDIASDLAEDRYNDND